MRQSTVRPLVQVTHTIPRGGSLISRRCSCGRHTPGGGMCPACAKAHQEQERARSAMHTAGPEVTVSDPHDRHEREAEAHATALFPASGAVGSVPSLSVARQANGSGAASAPVSLSGIRASMGQPLPEGLRTEMEGAFGADFSRVRIHTDDRAARLSRSLGADAFTFGNDIFFGASRFVPASPAGKHLIAHELTHTLQQQPVLGQISRQASGRTALQCVNDNLASMGIAAWLITIVGGACGLIGALAGSPTGPGAAGTAAMGAILCIAGLTGLSIGMVSRVVFECMRDPNARVGLPGTVSQSTFADSADTAMA